MAILDIDQLRQRHYNATVTTFRRVHDELAIFRVRPDGEQLSFLPGQYTVLGMGHWEPRLDHTQPEPTDQAQQTRLIRRAYSISSPLIDDRGDIVQATDLPDVEFYVALVRSAPSHPPALTPRLFLLNEGDRLHMGRRAHGRYTVEPVLSDDDILFCATGTGEAPHNAMIAWLLSRGHTGKIVAVVSVRYRHDLAYLKEYRALERAFPNFRYVPLTTRELQNLDPSHPDFVGKKYIQEYVDRGQLLEETGLVLNPASTRVYLCGNPDMVGLAEARDPAAEDRSKPIGMVKLLEGRGFRLDQPREPGNIHVEQYW